MRVRRNAVAVPRQIRFLRFVGRAVKVRLSNEETAPIPPPGSDSSQLRQEIERWFFELRDPVFRYLRTLGCRHSLAEDIAQEAFLRLHCALRDGLKVKHVRGWVFRVARNLAVDSQRDQQRHWQTHPQEEQLDEAHSDSAADPEQQILARERMRLVDEEVQRLPSLQRECVRLKVQGLRYHEIARELDISVSAAVDCMRTALKRLATRLRAKD